MGGIGTTSRPAAAPHGRDRHRRGEPGVVLDRADGVLARDHPRRLDQAPRRSLRASGCLAFGLDCSTLTVELSVDFSQVLEDAVESSTAGASVGHKLGLDGYSAFASSGVSTNCPKPEFACCWRGEVACLTIHPGSTAPQDDMC